MYARISRLARKAYGLPWKTVGRLDKLLYENQVRSAKKLCLPDFLGIGFPKAGTTWLYENLRAHPDIFVSHSKELASDNFVPNFTIMQDGSNRYF